MLGNKVGIGTIPESDVQEAESYVIAPVTIPTSLVQLGCTVWPELHAQYSTYYYINSDEIREKSGLSRIYAFLGMVLVNVICSL